MTAPNWTWQVFSEKRADKLCFRRTMKCSLVIKTNQLLTHATAQMNHTDIMMNESCQTAKRTYCAMPFIELKNRKNQSNATDQRFPARAALLMGGGLWGSGAEGGF